MRLQLPLWIPVSIKLSCVTIKQANCNENCLFVLWREHFFIHCKNYTIENIFRPHGEWTILSSSIESRELQETKENGDVEKFSQLDFYIKMKRKSNYYISSVLLPVILTSYLNIFVFLLPVDSGEKVCKSIHLLLIWKTRISMFKEAITISRFFFWKDFYLQRMRIIT